MPILTLCYGIAWTVCREYGLVNPRYAEISDQTCTGFRSSRKRSPTGLTGQTIVGDQRKNTCSRSSSCQCSSSSSVLLSRAGQHCSPGHGEAAEELAGHCLPSAQWQLPLWTQGCQGRLWSVVSQRLSITCDTSPKAQGRVQEIRSVPELISCLYFMRYWISEEHLMKKLAELQSWGRTDVSASLLGSASSASSLCTGKMCQTGLFQSEQFTVGFTFPAVVLSTLWTSLLSILSLQSQFNVLHDSQYRFHDIVLPVQFSCFCYILVYVLL